MEKRLSKKWISLLSCFIALSALMPIGAAAESLTQYSASIQSKDRSALIAAKNAMMSYALAAGKLPCAVDAAGACVTAVEGLMPPSSGAGAVPALGVNNFGAFGRENSFRMDVNNALLTTTDPKKYCAAVQGQLAAAGTGPMANSVAMAFVLYSTGSDRKPNQANAVVDRNYESESRGIDSSPGTNYYDDQLIAVPLSTFVRACGNVDLVGRCDPTAQACFLLDGNVKEMVSNTDGVVLGVETYSSNDKAFEFNGNTFVYATLNVNETAYTSSLWFNTSSVDGGIYSVYDFTTVWNGNDRDLYFDIAGNICAYTWSIETICTSGTNYADGAYHHLAHVLNGANQIIYIDGVEVVRGVKGFSDFNWQRFILFGFSRIVGKNFTGQIDKVQIFQKALTAAQVAELAAAVR